MVRFRNLLFSMNFLVKGKKSPLLGSRTACREGFESERAESGREAAAAVAAAAVAVATFKPKWRCSAIPSRNYFHPQKQPSLTSPASTPASATM